jgi:hypothetical protein
MRKVVTTYVCDACDKVVENRKALRSFHMNAGQGSSQGFLNAELCDGCESDLIVALGKIFHERKLDEVVSLRRPA